jgi:Flp pilus assembly protein TadD
LIYCLNPDCRDPINETGTDHCRSCGLSFATCYPYQPLELLHRQSRTSSIFAAVDQRDGTPVVIKVVTLISPVWQKILDREFRMLQKFQDCQGFPRAMATFILKAKGERRSLRLGCIVCSRLAGSNLKQWIQDQGRVGQAQAMAWLRQLLGLLQVVHGKGVIHRDIKPANIMVGPGGRLTLIDFATAREMTSEYYEALDQEGSETLIISQGYTPPEQWAMKAVPQSDYFALAQTIVFALTGLDPGERGSRRDWRQLAPISPGFALVLAQMMASAVADRPHSVAEILWRLDHLGLNRGLAWGRSRQLRWATVAVLAGIMGTVGAWPSVAHQHWLRQGNAALQAREFGEAEAKYRSALRWNQDNATAHNNLGLACELQEKWDCAQEGYGAALALKPQGALEPTFLMAHYNLGRAYDRDGLYDLAVREYRAAIVGTDTGISAANELARLLILENPDDPEALREAISLTSQALDLLQSLQIMDPERQGALLKNRGWAHLTLGQLTEAQGDLLQAIELQPQRPDAHCLLAQIQQLVDDQGALDRWQLCLDLESERNLDEVKAWKLLASQQIRRSKDY